MKAKLKWIYITLIIILAVNIWLSIYVAQQKAHNDGVAVEKCFLGDGGCYAVQTSTYATTFGIHNPYYGMFFFSLGVGLFILLTINLKHKLIPKHIVPHMLDIIGFGLILGSVFSIWLLYVQFEILQTTCKYCLWVDGLMIFATVLFWATRKLK